MNDQPPPTREEWGDLKADLDIEFGFQEVENDLSFFGLKAML